MIIGNDMSDGRDLLEAMLKEIYPKCEFISLRKVERHIISQKNDDKILTDINSSKMEQKPLPLTLRKRLLYAKMKAS